MSPVYQARRVAQSVFLPLRGLRYHAHVWGDASLVTANRPPLLLLHGWMDVGASFQFLVDELARREGFDRWVIAPDWRGFG
ncbi:MAG: alpha/beta hydrolase, partial [Rubrivivax sp.]|nr:alpha/beta hydrolase [Rubrivivax sp.]